MSVGEADAQVSEGVRYSQRPARCLLCCCYSVLYVDDMVFAFSPLGQRLAGIS